MAELACAAFKAFELTGAGAVTEANVAVFIHALIMLQSLDLSAPEATPIVEQLRQIPSALRFLLDHDLVHIGPTGMTTAAVCAQICAVVFGKEEDAGSFDFTEAQVDVFLAYMKDCFDGTLSASCAVCATSRRERFLPLPNAGPAHGHCTPGRCPPL